MKLTLLAAASVAAITIGSGTASAQPPAVVVPHRNHYHVVPVQPQVLVPHYNHYHAVPAYAAPVYGGYGYRNYAPLGGYSFNFSTFGGYSSFGYRSWGGYPHYHHR